MRQKVARVAARKIKKPLQEVPVDSQVAAPDNSPPGNTKVKRGSSKKRTLKATDTSSSQPASEGIHPEHSFTPNEAAKMSSDLLKWYDASKRDLPWRQLADTLSPEDRAYAVLVSEVMLQQTQVVTVKSYYEKWMSKWPTFSDLAKAPLEEVNELWAGMGYYSRARRLLEAAQKVDNELGGKVPLTSSELEKNLPGVGRYTAGAVASIAFGERCAAVDGNVIRVLARMCCLGADSTSKSMMEHVWKVADTIVPPGRPGDFNQAMMDLGATVCTPRKPLCSECPVSGSCFSFKRFSCKDIRDIEEVPCDLCCPEPLDKSLGVQNFPKKSKKAPPRSEVSLVCIVYHVDDEGVPKVLISQRPQGGLLAGLWEFPSLALSTPTTDDTPEERKVVETELLEKQWGVGKDAICAAVRRLKVVLHIFSHIRQQYVVYAAQVSDKSVPHSKSNSNFKWVDKEELNGTAISTAMKKVFQAFESADENEKVAQPASKKARNHSPVGSKKMTDFFQSTRKVKAMT